MNGKVCYLTIDEFPSEDADQKISFLENRNIPAILFARGDMLEKRPQKAVKAVEKGFILGNHSYDHPDFDQISIEKGKDQIEETDSIIDTIYSKAGVERKKKYFRFPYFNRGGERRKKAELQRFLGELGYQKPRFRNINYQWYRETGHQDYIDVSYTYSVDDFKLFEKGNSIETVQDILDKMDRDQPDKGMGLNHQKSNDIVFLHDHPFTDRKLSNQVFKKSIEKMLSKNLEFRLPPPHINPFRQGPPTLEDFL